MLPVRAKMINTMSKMCSGARRSFFCRMKCKVYSVKEEADTTTGSKYTQSGNFFLSGMSYHRLFNDLLNGFLNFFYQYFLMVFVVRHTGNINCSSHYVQHPCSFCWKLTRAISQSPTVPQHWLKYVTIKKNSISKIRIGTSVGYQFFLRKGKAFNIYFKETTKG